LKIYLSSIVIFVTVKLPKWNVIPFDFIQEISISLSGSINPVSTTAAFVALILCPSVVHPETLMIS